MKAITPIVWIVPAILLVIATAQLPYGYYTFLRIVTCGAAGIIAFIGFKEARAIQVWSIPFALVTILFNPIIPIYLTRSTWFYIDLAAAALFVAHLILVRQKFSEALKQN